MSDATVAAFAALLVNTVLCVIFAGTPDSFIISNAILAAALVLAIKGERHG